MNGKIEYNGACPQPMKKYIVVVIFLFLLAIVFPLVATQTQTIEAATPATVAPTPPVKTESTREPAPVAYTLPYPGILPTHPLYFLKSLRDSIIETIIVDPIKKGEFYILQSDKKLNMAIFLYNDKKNLEATHQLAESLALREKALVHLEALKQQGTKIPRFVAEKLSDSLTKHIEVVTGYKKGIDALQAMLARSQKLFNADDNKSDQ